MPQQNTAFLFFCLHTSALEGERERGGERGSEGGRETEKESGGMLLKSFKEVFQTTCFYLYSKSTLASAW